jgi:hypothetical protein
MANTQSHIPLRLNENEESDSKDAEPRQIYTRMTSEELFDALFEDVSNPRTGYPILPGSTPALPFKSWKATGPLSFNTRAQAVLEQSGALKTLQTNNRIMPKSPLATNTRAVAASAESGTNREVTHTTGFQADRHDRIPDTIPKAMVKHVRTRDGRRILRLQEVICDDEGNIQYTAFLPHLETAKGAKIQIVVNREPYEEGSIDWDALDHHKGVLKGEIVLAPNAVVGSTIEQIILLDTETQIESLHSIGIM